MFSVIITSILIIMALSSTLIVLATCWGAARASRLEEKMYGGATINVTVEPVGSRRWAGKRRLNETHV